jgi:hypothetical protein
MMREQRMSSQSKDKKVNPWKIVLVGGPVLLLVLLVAVYSLFAFAFPQGKAQYAARYQSMLKKLDGTPLSPDRRALLCEIGALAGDKDASLPAVVILVGVASDALRDNQLSDEEYSGLVQVRDFVTAKGCTVGFDEMGDFLAANPKIKAILENHGISSSAPAAASPATCSGFPARRGRRCSRPAEYSEHI